MYQFCDLSLRLMFVWDGVGFWWHICPAGPAPAETGQNGGNIGWNLGSNKVCIKIVLKFSNYLINIMQIF